jgi:signal transduction histidine kinase/CheY-like chemotaxis protein
MDRTGVFRVIKKLKANLHRYLISKDTPLNGRLFNVTMVLGFVGSIGGWISTWLQASSSISIFSTSLLPVGIVLFFIWVNKTRNYRLGGLVASGVICDIVFPFIFFSSGGVYSGMIAYQLLGTVIISILLKGWDFFIMLTLFLVISASCFFLHYINPELVTPIASEFLIYADIASSFIIASILIVTVLKYQTREYINAQKTAEDERERAESASRSKSDFLSNMSHEMRTPMNAIIGMTAIAKASSDSKRKDDCLSKIEAASTHLLGVINDILDMSKIEANKLELSFAEFDFEATIQKAVDVINFRIEERHQNLSVHLDKKIPRRLMGDDQRLAQVITNLLSNAVKFTPEYGSVKLDASLISEKDGISTIKIRVTDTGIGISEEQQARLFSSFQQAESNTSRKFGGTGLGLAISKRIVEMMGGKIWIESELGKGAVFSFTIRARRGAEDHSGTDSGRAARLRPETYIFEGCHVILAEDVEINREIVLSLLEPTLLSIQCAENGTEAVKLYRENPELWDLIFMDVQMPEMDGYEATRCIRALDTPTAKTIPIVAMTANVFREDIKKCIDAGMNDHVGKPLNFDEVLNKLYLYLPIAKGQQGQTPEAI